MDENPYRAPQERPLIPPVANGSGRPYETVSQRFISVALLLFAFLGPFGLATLSIVFYDTQARAIEYAASIGALIWLSAVGWLIIRVIRRNHTPESPS